jgi:AraC family transcriptional regulator
VVCHCCTRIIRQRLEHLPVIINHIGLGDIMLTFDNKKTDLKIIEQALTDEGFPVLVDKEKILVEDIKTAVIELIHFANNKSSIIRNSDYLVEKLGMSYQTLSTVFSKNEPMTLEKFIILHKIERVKELLEYNELTLSEIAYDMGYSSVQYLSTVFKSITGISVTEYKKSPLQKRKAINEI